MERTIHTFDATDQVLGRLATKIAVLLRGKHKPTWSPNVDDGDVVVVNSASKIRVTGRKTSQKVYYSHTGYQGHVKEPTLRERLAKEPDRVLIDAVRGMLPDNRLRPAMVKRLTVNK